MNVYWFCYEAIRLWGVNIGVVDKIPVSYTHLDDSMFLSDLNSIYIFQFMIAH